MKKVLALIITLVWLLSISYAKEITYKNYGTMYLNIFTNFYNNKIYLWKDVIRVWTPNHKEIWKIIEEKIPYKKSQIYWIALWDNVWYSTYLFILKNKTDINYIFEKYDYNVKTLLDKPYIQILNSKLYTWTNYIYTCKWLSINRNSMWNWKTPMVVMVCSTPNIIYKLQNKVYLDENKYNKDYKEYLQKQNKLEQAKIELLDKIIKYKTNNKCDYNYLYNIAKKVYNIDNINSIDELTKLKTNSYMNKYSKFARYRFDNNKLVFQILDKNNMQIIVNNAINDRINYLKNKQEQLKQQQEDYKNNALNNYGTLLKKYNILKQEYENYKKLTKENRQKAIKLTIVLTKIVSKYHNKEKKLAILDKVDNIIATKYWPDKFKNQDLIWYVKDYLKIIRLAIQLSE